MQLTKKNGKRRPSSPSPPKKRKEKRYKRDPGTFWNVKLLWCVSSVRLILQQLLDAHDKQEQTNPPAIFPKLIALARKYTVQLSFMMINHHR